MDVVRCISISRILTTSPTIGVSALGHGCRQLQLIVVNICLRPELSARNSSVMKGRVSGGDRWTEGEKTYSMRECGSKKDRQCSAVQCRRQTVQCRRQQQDEDEGLYSRNEGREFPLSVSIISVTLFIPHYFTEFKKSIQCCHTSLYPQRCHIEMFSHQCYPTDCGLLD